MLIEEKGGIQEGPRVSGLGCHPAVGASISKVEGREEEPNFGRVLYAMQREYSSLELREASRNGPKDWRASHINSGLKWGLKSESME